MAKLENYATFKNMEKEIERLKGERNNLLKVAEMSYQYLKNQEGKFVEQLKFELKKVIDEVKEE